MGTYQRWCCVCGGDKQGVQGVGLRYLHLDYLPMKGMCPHGGQWVKWGVSSRDGWKTIWQEVGELGVTWDEVLVCLVVPGPKDVKVETLPGFCWVKGH